MAMPNAAVARERFPDLGSPGVSAHRCMLVAASYPVDSSRNALFISFPMWLRN